VVESRRIFRKLKSYVTYRFAATIQIVIVLTLLIFISNCPINSLYVIILALFNDLTMLPIAYDNQTASKVPENPNVVRMLTVSLGLGVLETIFSLVFAYGVEHCGNIFAGDYAIGQCNRQTQAIIWVQMFISAELLIFTTRASSYMFVSQAPSLALVTSVLIGCLVVSAMAAGAQQFGELHIVDIVLVWVYDIVGLIFLDILKVAMFNFFEENTSVLPDLPEGERVKHVHGHDVEAGHGAPTHGATSTDGEDFTRASLSANRLTDWAIQHSERLSSMDANQRMSMASGRSLAKRSHNMANHENNKHVRESMSGNIMTPRQISAAGGSELRPSFIGGNIRPNVPGNRTKF
jgi:hypothetical protein